MKRIVLILTLAVVSAMSIVSCEEFSFLFNQEELLSLTSEEQDALLVGKWICKDAGYSLSQDDMTGLEHIDKDGYPEVDTAIESIEIASGGQVTFYFKGSVSFEFVSYEPMSSTHKNLTSYTVPSDHRMRFGFDWDPKEYFVVHEDIGGGVECDFTLYGTEDRSENYDVTRIICRAGMISEPTYYEFIPAKK
jgi:hypothetical protein